MRPRGVAIVPVTLLALPLGFAVGGAAQTPTPTPRDPPSDPPALLVPAPRPHLITIESMTLGEPPQGNDGKAMSLVRTDAGGPGDLRQWLAMDGGPCPWRVVDGELLAGASDIRSAREFGDVQLHVEFFLPRLENAFGQGRANSGVILQGRYELQILDSFGQPPKLDGCGAVMKQVAPIANASQPPTGWQTFDVIFRAARFAEDGSMQEAPRVTALLNGLVIHNNVELPAPTEKAPLDGPPAPLGPIVLQGNDQGVRFRNVWVRIP